MNRRGFNAGDAANIWIFLLLVVVIAGGIVLGVLAFFDNGDDLRELEASVLMEKVSVCFDRDDFFAVDFQLERCGIDQGVIEDEHLVYVQNLESGEEFYVGVLDFVNQCFFSGAEDNENFPRCEKREVVKGGESFSIIIGSNQKLRSVAR